MVSSRRYSALWTTKPSSGCTGPPAKTRNVPSTPETSSPDPSSRLAIDLSAKGRLMMMPNAPSLSCLIIKMTAWAKRGSPILGEAIRSCPVSESIPGGSAAAGERSIAARRAAAGIERRVEIREEDIVSLVHGLGRSLHRRSSARKAMLRSPSATKKGPRMPTQSWIITTVVGTGERGFGGDGGLAERALLNGPFDVGFDADGNLYFSDTFNHRIRRVDVRTGIITTCAGSGEAGYSGDRGPAIRAQLNEPYGIAIDRAANVYIADRHNHCVRRVDGGSGVITTFVGNGAAGFGGDGGPASRAGMVEPNGLAFDPAQGRLLSRMSPTTGSG